MLPVDLTAALDAIRSLDLDQRIALVQAIWDDIAADGVLPDLDEAQRAELDRRLAAADANPDDVVPWEEVRARALARLRR
jgi:putative addiction module component (TIGR02574 family)